MYLIRSIEEKLRASLQDYPVVAVVGPRQCGKSTLVKVILEHLPGSIYLDLERPSDLRKLDDAEWYLSTQKNNLVCMDEIQRVPRLFPIVRSLVDEWGKTGSFIVLGSASRDLLMQSSESLAGRISFVRLTPFLWSELKNTITLEDYFTRGGFPRSILARNQAISFEWRENFITTFLERDLLLWKSITPTTMHRLWQMIAHINGQTVDYITLARSLGVSSVTIKNYIDLLENTFMLDVVQPYHSNMGKRLVKAPKIYISDSGITACLLGLRNFHELTGHPSFGGIWEQIVLANLKGQFPEAAFYFYRTTNGAEIDFIMTLRNHVFAIECKSSLSPVLSKGSYTAREDISPEHFFVVCPVTTGWSMKEGIDVVSIDEVIVKINEHLKIPQSY